MTIRTYADAIKHCDHNNLSLESQENEAKGNLPFFQEKVIFLIELFFQLHPSLGKNRCKWKTTRCIQWIKNTTCPYPRECSFSHDLAVFWASNIVLRIFHHPNQPQFKTLACRKKLLCEKNHCGYLHEGEISLLPNWQFELHFHIFRDAPYSSDAAQRHHYQRSFQPPSPISSIEEEEPSNDSRLDGSAFFS